MARALGPAGPLLRVVLDYLDTIHGSAGIRQVVRPAERAPARHVHHEPAYATTR